MLLRSIQSTEDAVEHIEQQISITTKLTIGGGFVFSIGVTSWLFRASSLVSTMLSSMPLWKRLDPLPVLSLSGKERVQCQRQLKEIEQEESQLDNKVSAFFSNDAAQDDGQDLE